MEKSIFISTSSFGKFDRKPLDLLEEKGVEYCLNSFGRKLSKSESMEKYKDIDGLIAGTEALDCEVLKIAKDLKVISRVGVGMDNVDIGAADNLGIKVYNTPDGPTRPVAELTLGLILDCLRKISEHDRLMRQGIWKKTTGNLLYGKTLGILGLGRIGKMVVELTKPFGLNYIAWDEASDYEFAKENNVEYMSLEEVLSNSDIVTMHLPYKDSLKNFIGDRELHMMKKNSILINIARGGLVDEKALYNALKSNTIEFAAIDVFGKEPYEGMLRQLDNVILTPHIGSAAKEARVMMEMQAVENLLKGLGLL